MYAISPPYQFTIADSDIAIDEFGVTGMVFAVYKLTHRK